MENLGILLQKFNSACRDKQFPESLIRELNSNINNEMIVGELKSRVNELHGLLDDIVNQINPEDETGKLQEDSNGAAD